MSHPDQWDQPPIPSPEEDFLEEDVIKLGSLLYNHLQDQINLADTKAHLILAANAVLAAAMTGFSKGMILTLFNSQGLSISRISAFFTLIMFLSLLFSFYYILRVTRPIMKVTDQDMKNLFYFGGIKNHHLDEFVEAFMTLPPDRMKEEMLLQVHAKAHIAHRKFCRVRTSMNFLIIAMMLWATTYVIHSFVP